MEGSVSEKRAATHEQPVAVQCWDIYLYSEVSGCATCCKLPPARDTFPQKSIRNIMPRPASDIAVRIYHSGRTRDLHLVYFLSSRFIHAIYVHYASWDETISVGKIRHGPKIPSKLAGKQRCKYA